MDRLGNAGAAIHFARKLWSWVLDVCPATLFVCMGRLPADELKLLSNGRLFMANLPTGYKRQTIDAVHGQGRCIVRMPHPSQFMLFGRNEGGEEAAASLRLAAGMEP